MPARIHHRPIAASLSALALAGALASCTTIRPPGPTGPPGPSISVGTRSPVTTVKVGAQVRFELNAGRTAPVLVVLDSPAPGPEARDVAALKAAAALAQDQVAAVPELRDAIRGRFATIPALRLDIKDRAMLDRLAAVPNVVKVDLDEASGGIDQEPPAPRDTSVPHPTLADVRADTLHREGLTGQGRTVAIIDTGIDRTHRDLAGAVVQEACFSGIDGSTAPQANAFCPNGLDRMTGQGAAFDKNGHGTHVAGIVTADGIEAGPGVAPGADIVAIKTTNGGPFRRNSDIALSLDYLAAQPELKLDAVNMSLHFQQPTTAPADCDKMTADTMAIAKVVATLRAQNVVVVAASGNKAVSGSQNAPACVRDVLSVGSSDRNAIYGGASISRTTDLVAPGVGVMSAQEGGGEVANTGTSMAAPAVVGCIALLRQADPSLTPAAIEQGLKDTGVKLTRTVDGVSYTVPRVDCAAAKRALVPSGAPR